MSSGPPYAPTQALLGGQPSIAVDVPITAVFIAMFLSSAITNITIFNLNKRRQHKFLISIMLTGFSMARVMTCVLRIVWATRLNNVSLSIAAMLFNNLGVFLLYIINLLFAQRILRARRPSIGWDRRLRIAFTVVYSLVAVVAVLVISFTVLTFYTRDASLLTAARDIQLAASTYLTVLVLLPWVVLVVAYLPSNDAHQHFGHESVEKKTLVLLVLTTLMVLEQGFKYGTAWVAPVPAAAQPWYFSKACFYCFGFMLEILWLVTAISLRVDLRFHVPNGSSKRNNYLPEEKTLAEVEEEIKA